MRTFELLTIIGSIAAVGIALGAVVIGSNANLRSEMRTEMHTLRMEVRAELTDMRNDIRSLETRLSAVEQRQAKTEGLLEGLRDAITANARQDPPGENDAT